MYLDQQKNQTLKDVAPKLKEIYHDLLKKYSRKRYNLYKRQTIHCDTKPDEDEEKMMHLERMIRRRSEQLEFDDIINDVVLEMEEKEKEFDVKKVFSKHKKHPNKCESKYDWSYVKGFTFGEDASSPSITSAISLMPTKSYYDLPDDKKYLEEERKQKHISCNEGFIGFPKYKGGSYLRKALALDKTMLVRKRIEDIKEDFIKWRSQTNLKYIASHNAEKNNKPLQLVDQINLGYVPDLEDRTDLISLFKKIKPKKIKRSKDWELRCNDCEQFEEPKPKKVFYIPNTYRQLEVLQKYTPKDHEDWNVVKKQQTLTKTMQILNESYYGKGPTIWKCARTEDLLIKSKESSNVNSTEHSVCIEKSNVFDIADKFPTFLLLTKNDLDIIKLSWKNRGINKNTLIMLWFARLFKSDQESLQRILPGQTFEEAFLDETFNDYMRCLADTFDMVVQNLDHPTLCTNLVWDVGILHVCLDVNSEFFQTLRTTFFETIEENIYPKLDAKKLKAWEKLVHIIFKFIHDLFLWNKWPPKKSGDMTQVMDVEVSEVISDTTECSPDYSTCPPIVGERNEEEEEGEEEGEEEMTDDEPCDDEGIYHLNLFPEEFYLLNEYDQEIEDKEAGNCYYYLNV